MIGSGQSGAEVFLDLLRGSPDGGRHVTWLTASPAFAPMEYSKLGLEHFTPDYTRFFRTLPQSRRDELTELGTRTAQEVKDSGQSVRLRPMTPFERKVVHDAGAAVEGVHSESEGEDPRRRVVVFRQS